MVRHIFKQFNNKKNPVNSDYKPMKSSGRPRLKLDADSIIFVYEQGGCSMSELGRIYGCSESTIRRIVKGTRKNK